MVFSPRARPMLVIEAEPQINDVETTLIHTILQTLSQHKPGSSFRISFLTNKFGESAALVALTSVMPPKELKCLYMSCYFAERCDGLAELVTRIRDEIQSNTPLSFIDGGHAVFGEITESGSKYNLGAIGIKSAAGSIITDVEKWLVLNSKNERDLARDAKILLLSTLYAAHVALPEHKISNIEIHIHRFHAADRHDRSIYYRASCIAKVPVRSPKFLKPPNHTEVGPLMRDLGAAIKQLRKHLLMNPAKHTMEFPMKIGEEARQIWQHDNRCAPGVQIPRGHS